MATTTPTTSRDRSLWVSIHNLGIGDVVNSLPFLESLHDHSRHSRIDVSAPEHCHPILAPLLGGALVAEGMRPGLQRYDLAIEIVSGRHHRNLSVLDARRCACLETFGVQDRSQRVWQSLREQAAAEGFVVPETRPRIVPTNFARREGARWIGAQAFGEEKRPLILMHCSAGFRAKCWSPERFGMLADALHRRLGAIVILSLGPDDDDVSARVQQAAGSELCLARDLGLDVLAAVMEQCDLFVSADCGPMHLASAVNCAVVALFGPTSPDVWGPVSDVQEILWHRPPTCPACGYGVAGRCPHRRCLEDLEVDSVLQACERVLARTNGSRGAWSNPRPSLVASTERVTDSQRWRVSANGSPSSKGAASVENQRATGGVVAPQASPVRVAFVASTETDAADMLGILLGLDHRHDPIVLVRQWHPLMGTAFRRNCIAFDFYPDDAALVRRLSSESPAIVVWGSDSDARLYSSLPRNMVLIRGESAGLRLPDTTPIALACVESSDESPAPRLLESARLCRKVDSFLATWPRGEGPDKVSVLRALEMHPSSPTILYIPNRISDEEPMDAELCAVQAVSARRGWNLIVAPQEVDYVRRIESLVRWEKVLRIRQRIVLDWEWRIWMHVADVVITDHPRAASQAGIVGRQVLGPEVDHALMMDALVDAIEVSLRSAARSGRDSSRAMQQSLEELGDRVSKPDSASC